MTVAAILKHIAFQAIIVAPTTHIRDVSQALAPKRAGAVLVVDRADQLLGIVSERDIIQSLAANGTRTLEMTAGQLMTRAVKTASPQTSIGEAMRMMTAGKFRHLPVLENDALIGMISIADVVRAHIMQEEGALA